MSPIRRPSLTLGEPDCLQTYHPLQKVAVLTCGEICPGISSVIGYLIQYYHDYDPSIEIILYKHGFKGLLLKDYVNVDDSIRSKAYTLEKLGGSPCGSSEVRLSEPEDCLKAGLISEGDRPIKLASENIKYNDVQVLHILGGGEGVTSAMAIQESLRREGYELQVIVFPMSVLNDVYSVSQSIGAWTAAVQGANYFRNIVYEHSSSPKMLIIHECKGWDSGWLTAATALKYQNYVDKQSTCVMTKDQLSIHGLYIPEVPLNIEKEASRLKGILDEHNCCNIFLSEGAAVRDIIDYNEDNGIEVERDCFGLPRLEAISPSRWFGEVFAKMIGAHKVMIQNSTYYARASPANEDDNRLARTSAELALKFALEGGSGMIGRDESEFCELTLIELTRVGVGKSFDTDTLFYTATLEDIGQIKRRSESATMSKSISGEGLIPESRSLGGDLEGDCDKISSQSIYQ